MNIYDFAIQNKGLLRLFYTVIVGLVCFAIVIKTDKLFRLSLHQGIRYFRNAFFFYGLAFILRYLLGTAYPLINMGPVMKIVFEFFLIMAGFSLLYSLLWKKLETKKSPSSLFNTKIAIFYALALVLAFLDFLWGTYCFMFISQIILFSYASIISYINYKKSGKQHSFLKLYFIVMILNLIAWMSNFIVGTFLNWSQKGIMNIYLLNIIIFLLFLYGVIKATKKSANL